MAKKLVLIVESNPTTREVLASLLEDEIPSVRAAQAVDFIGAMRLARELRPAVIVLDVELVGFDGLILAERLRSEPATDQIPLIAISADPNLETRLRAAQAGCDAVCSSRLFDQDRHRGEVIPMVREYLHGRMPLVLEAAS